MFEALKDLVWVTQLGFSIISPLLVCVLGSAWLRGRLGLGPWVIVVGLLLGMGGAISAGITFYRHTRQLTKPPKNQKPNPVSFNQHD